MTADAPLIGERVTLRTATHDDAGHLVRWASDDQFAWMQWARLPGRFADEAAAQVWIERFSTGQRAARLFIIEHERRAIGFANYRDLDPEARNAEIGIGIGEPALWSRGLGREALRLLVRHLVADLGLHRVGLHTMAYNYRAIASYKACGFEVEGVNRDEVWTERGAWADAVAMAYIEGRTRPAFDPRPVVLEGSHVRLEPLRMEHADELLAAASDPAIWTYMTQPMPQSVADMERYVADALDQQVLGHHMPWLTRRQSDGVAIGTTRYGAIERDNASVEIGWTFLSADARRTTANTEAKYLQLTHAFDTLGARRVWLKTDALNERSRNAIGRIGAKPEGVLRQERLLWNGRVRDTAVFSFVADEWPEAKARLQSLLA